MTHIAPEAGEQLIYQLYVHGDDRWVGDRVEKAVAAGVQAFCLTVDVPHYGRRDRSLLHRFQLPGRPFAGLRTGEEYAMRLDWTWSRSSNASRQSAADRERHRDRRRCDARARARRRRDLRVESRRSPARSRPRCDGHLARGGCGRARQGDHHRRRRLLPRHRCAQGARDGRGPRRARPPAGARGRGRRSRRRAADAGDHRGRAQSSR